MSDDSTHTAITRIAHALDRIEARATQLSQARVPDDGDTRYQALRTRTRAALASLETVIAQIGPPR